MSFAIPSNCLIYSGKVAKPAAGGEKTAEWLQGIADRLHASSQPLHTFLCGCARNRKFAPK